MRRPKPFFRHVGALTVSQMVGVGLSLVQGLLVARWLGPRSYGIASLIISYPLLVFTFFDARMGTVLIKYLEEFSARKEKEKALATIKLGYVVDGAIAALTLGVVFITAGWAQIHIVKSGAARPLMLFLALCFLPQALRNTSAAVLSVLGRFYILGWVEAGIALIQTVLVLGLLWMGWGIAGVIIGNGVGMAVSGILFGAVVHPLMKKEWGGGWWRTPWKKLKGEMRGILRFVFFMDLSELLGMVTKRLDIILLGYFRGPQEVGYYKLAKSFAGLAGNIVGPLQSVTYPKLAGYAGHRRFGQMKKVIRRLAVQIGLPLGVLVGLGGVFFIPWLLPLLVGPHYLPARKAIQILFLGSAFWVACFWLRPTFMALGEVRRWFYLGLVGVGINALGMVGVTFQWGYEGLVWWMMASQVWGHLMFIIWLYGRRWSSLEGASVIPNENEFSIRGSPLPQPFPCHGVSSTQEGEGDH